MEEEWINILVGKSKCQEVAVGEIDLHERKILQWHLRKYTADWIHLAQYVYYCALVDMVMNIPVP
jgi:hypothetical protein